MAAAVNYMTGRERNFALRLHLCLHAFCWALVQIVFLTQQLEWHNVSKGSHNVGWVQMGSAELPKQRGL